MTIQKIDTKEVAKHLLNAWSAEYALRLTPAMKDNSYLESATHWTFPQAYYSPLFMVRAFLAARGFYNSDEYAILIEVDNLIDAGIYPANQGWRLSTGQSFLENMHRMRLSKHNDLSQYLWKNLLDQHNALIADVTHINEWHEQQLRSLLGTDAYNAIITAIPEYISKGFLAQRTP